MTAAGWRLRVHRRERIPRPWGHGPYGGSAAVRDRRGATREEILGYWDVFWVFSFGTSFGAAFISNVVVAAAPPPPA